MRSRFLEHRDFWPLLVASAASLLAVLMVVVREYTPEWKHHTETFRNLLKARGAYDAASVVPEDVQQIWLPALDRVDRCMSCHVNYDASISTLPELPALYRAHPDLPYMAKHPFPTFGCTACHGGQGYALDEAGAHGLVEHWDDPLLTTALATQYGLTRAQLMETKCNTCHRHDDSTAGTDLVNMAKEIFDKKHCTSCHGLLGSGGLAASDLSYDGDLNPEYLDFSAVDGPKTALNWQIQHFKSPQKLVQRSGMPNYRLNDDQAKALALLMLSWQRISFPPQYIPAARKRPTAVLPVVRDVPYPPSSTTPLGQQGRYIFMNRGCNTCHRIGGGKLIGPDLAGVTKRRNDKWLTLWLKDPAAVVARDPELQTWSHEFGDIVMPNQNLDEAEVNAVIGYMKEFPETDATNHP
ncbi:MAG: cytochrome c [Deltaproteobacteria bacterium]|nr:cytochrome c [Deltaproteobacteria bacterium]MBI3390140.1 cytochrome c [Deltaproteobacteria bacterium]